MKQKRYLAKDGKRDWIDKCADEMTLEAFNGAMFFNIGKYYQRLGKKDPEEQEKGKIVDYMQRWSMVLTEAHGIEPINAEDFVFAQVERAKQLAQE